MDESSSLAEALMTRIAFEHTGKKPPDELEVLDVDMRSSGQWRLIFWVRPKPGSKLFKLFGGSIHTLILHHNSFVEVIADASQPTLPSQGG